ARVAPPLSLHDALPILVPMMYAQAVAGNGDQLTTDDRAALTALYPNPNAVTTGTIRGQVLLPDGVTGLQGINVIARRFGDTSTRSEEHTSALQSLTNLA